MTVRLAIIGNSHIGALATALQAQPDVLGPDIQATLFARGSNRVIELDVIGQVIRPRDPSVREHYAGSSGGQDQIDTTRFDAFYVTGLQWTIPRTEVSVSIQMLDAIVAAQLERAMNFTFVRLLRNLSDAPIYASPHPLLSKPLRHVRIVTYKHIFDRFEAATRDLNVTLLRQSLATRSEDMVTDKKFRRVSDRGNNESHMNGAYGAICLTDLRNHITRDFGLTTT